VSIPPPSFSAHPELPDGAEAAPAPGPPAAGAVLEPTGLAPVPAWVPFLALLAAFVGGSIVALVIGGIAAVAGARVSASATSPGVTIAGGVVQDVVFVAAAYGFAHLWAQRPALSVFGLRTTPPGRAALWGIAIFVAFIVFSQVYGSLLGSSPEQEEFFFRGFLYGVLRERLGVPRALILGGTVFGVIHVLGTPISALPVLVVLGIGLCLLYERTGSLLPGMALHSLNNAIAFSATVTPAPWVVLLLVAGGPLLVVLLVRAVGVRPGTAPAIAAA
jgi:uncharacterized protein